MKNRVKIPTLFVLIMVVVMMTVSMIYIQHFRFEEQMMQQVTDYLRNSFKTFNDDFNGIIGQIQGFNEYLGMEENVISVIKEDSHDKLTQVKAQNVLKKEYNRLYSAFFRDSNDFVSASFFIDKDMPFAKKVSDAKQIRNLGAVFGGIYNSEGVEQAEWYRLAIEKSSGINMFWLDEKPNHVFFAQTVVNNLNYNDEVIGVNVIGFDLKQKLYQFSNIGDNIAASVFVLDKNDDLICCNTENYQIDVTEFMNQYRAASETFFRNFKTIKYNGKDYIAAVYRTSMETNLLILVPEQTVKTKISEIGKLYSPSFLFEMLVVFLVAMILSKSIVFPIKRLANFMVNFEKNLETPMPKRISSLSEINELYLCYERMRERIKTLLVEAKRSGIKEKELDFKMLQTQIKPHFIYNALDSITWMALRKQQSEIANMLTALSDSFRYTIRLTEDCVSVQEEIAFTKSYIQLQKLYYGERLDYDIKIDEDYLNFMTPKFILQPIVENAIVHGYGHEKEKLTVFITLKKEENAFCFCVRDDGIGCDIEVLNRFLSKNSHLVSEEKIGIRNVHNRLLLRYGEEYGLSYETNDSGGITAMLRIPIIPIESNEKLKERRSRGASLNE